MTSNISQMQLPYKNSNHIYHLILEQKYHILDYNDDNKRSKRKTILCSKRYISIPLNNSISKKNIIYNKYIFQYRVRWL